MLILVTKVPQEGTPYPIAINVQNIVEVAPKDGTTSWLKYWDGQQIRSSVIQETPEQVAQTSQRVVK